MKNYTPTNWYWIVADSTTQVFSSASGTFVSVNNPTYVAWRADGTEPTRINSIEDLGGVLAVVEVRPTDAAVFDAYQAAAADLIVTKTIFRVLFNHENRLRAIERNLGLNGSPPNLTQQQARAAVKALM